MALDNFVQAKDARFTVLSNGIVRMEFSAEGKFDDRLSLRVSARPAATGSFKTESSDDSVQIKTEWLALSYKSDGKPFSADNLKIGGEIDGQKFDWVPGQKDEQNLGGTIRTLDGCNGGIHIGFERDKEPTKLDFGRGLLSRSGWSVIDDSDGIRLGDKDGWVADPHAHAGGYQDLYFVAYGQRYKQALKESSRVFGEQPIPPRFALGYWWSRYWAYRDQDLEQIVEECDQRGIPMDVLIIDMDWHKQGWTGFSWEPSHFPDPEDFLRRMKEKEIHISMNLHPADGFGSHEDDYEIVGKKLGFDTSSGEAIPFEISHKETMEAYFQVLKKFEDQGVRFWWIDWQQGDRCAMEGLDPLPWLNQLHWEHAAKAYPKDRPLCFSRYWDIGSGRYPVGFSGDTYVSWDSLALQPWMTATAGNVLYGYWSHDIGGHFHGEATGELYTRWIQVGTFSPVLRTHATKQTTNDRQFWEMGLPYSRIMKNLVKRRYELIPYLYTALRTCFDEALPLCRPMYYEHPTQEQAYNSDAQYYFGDEMILAPITSPADEATMEAKQTVWLPEGHWYEESQGKTFSGGQSLDDAYTLEELPCFVRAGAVIPGQYEVNRLRKGSFENLLLTVYPAEELKGELYEDDGDSEGYRSGEFVRMSFSGSASDESLSLEIDSGDSSSFDGFKAQRELRLRIKGRLPASSVKVGGREIPWSYRPEAGHWSYLGDEGSIFIDAGEVDLSSKVKVELEFPAGSDHKLTQGLAGFVRRSILGFEESQILELNWERELSAVAQVGNRISRWPETAAEELSGLSSKVSELLKSADKCREELKDITRYQEKRSAALEKACNLVKRAEQLRKS